jgi:hypothetical protein
LRLPITEGITKFLASCIKLTTVDNLIIALSINMVDGL